MSHITSGRNNQDDTFIPINVVRKYKLQPGDVICGEAREPKENDRYWGLLSITSVNDAPLEEYLKQTRVKFHQLTPVYPDEQIKLETGGEPFSTRIVTTELFYLEGLASSP